MVADDPESFADLDGHCCSNDDIDYGIGVLRGIASSVTFGAIGAPKATDSPSSLAGQISGTGIAGVAGEVIKDAGEGTVTVSLAAELPSGGTSTITLAAGGVGVVAGQAVEVGAAANVARIAAVAYQKSSTDKPHGNTAGDQPADLYERYDKDGKFEKHGVSQDASKRYSKKELDGGRVEVKERGPRKEMLKKERQKVETNPGPKNKEPWAGKQKKPKDDKDTVKP